MNTWILLGGMIITWALSYVAGHMRGLRIGEDRGRQAGRDYERKERESYWPKDPPETLRWGSGGPHLEYDCGPCVKYVREDVVCAQPAASLAVGLPPVRGRGSSAFRGFPNACAVRERTADGTPVGRCYFHTENGVCPRHGNVSMVQEEYVRTGRLTDEGDLDKMRKDQAKR